MAYDDGGMVAQDEDLDFESADKILDDGQYDFKVVDAQYKASSTAKHMVKLQLEVIAAATEEATKFIGKKIYTQLVFAQSSLFFVKQFMVAAGLDPIERATKENCELFAEQALGAEVSAIIKNQPYEGRMTPQVKSFMSLSTLEDEAAPEPAAPPAKPTATNGAAHAKTNGTPAKAPPAKAATPPAAAKKATATKSKR